jgi:hypothetical protein
MRRITNASVEHQLRRFAKHVGKETRQQLIERIIEEDGTKEYWKNPKFDELNEQALEVHKFMDVYGLANGSESRIYNGSYTSKRALHSVLSMVNDVLEERI